MQTCEVCGEANPPQARYCMFCRNALRVVAWSEEIRRVTVLFADLAGSTALISQRHPEDARTLLDRVIARMRPAVRQFGGSVTRQAGDGILALFGAPVAVEDHARRAAFAALRMQADMAREPLHGPDGEPLMIRVGINTGDVLLRAVASDLHVEYTAEGVTTHIAAKLQQEAAPGSVLVSAEIAAAVEGFIETRATPPLRVRGMAQPLVAFELGEATQTQSRFQVAVGRGLTPLVGRDAELSQLEQFAADAAQGRTRTIGVAGEPGVGKSRLLWEFGRRLAARGWRVASAQASSNGSAVAYHPMLALLRNLYGIEPEDDASTLLARLQAPADAQRLDLPPLLALFGLPVGDAKWDLLDTRERQQRTQHALIAALTACSRTAPLLLCIEDVHDADTETLALVDRIVRRGTQGRIALLLEYRRGRAFAFEPLPGFTTLALEPLAECDARVLFRMMCGAHPGAEQLGHLEQHLIERVAGNPFFIEEGVRMLVDPAARGREGSRTGTGNGKGKDIPIPGSVMDVIEARIAQLGPDEREVVKLASVIGRHAHLPILQGICPLDTQRIEAGIARLVDAGLLEQGSDAPLATLRFKHAVTRDVAYRMLTRPERQRIHSDIVGLLESKPLTTLSERIALLARHALGAELWPQALEYLGQAAQLATERALPREAVRLLDDAMAVLPRLPAAQRTPEREIDLHLALRGPLLALGNLPRIGDALRQLETLSADCEDPLRLGRVAVVVAGHRWLSGEQRLAVEAGRRAIDIAQRLDDFSLLVPARQYVGAALHELGEFQEAMDHLSANVEDVPEDAPGHRFGMAGLPAVISRATRGWAAGHLGAFDAAWRDANDALRIARAGGQAWSILSATFTAGALHLARHEDADASALLAEALALCEQHGLRMWPPVLGPMRALALSRMGEIDAACRLLDQVVPRVDNPVLSTAILVTVAQTQLRVGRIDDARRVTATALARARRCGERIWEAEALALTGEIAAASSGDGRATAAEAFAAALQLAQALGMQPLATRVRAQVEARAALQGS